MTVGVQRNDAEMSVTLRDIATRLNLSTATVSFVLNERRDVVISDATRQKVFEAAREMGYRPNRMARALVSGRTQMLAVSLPAIKHPYYISLFHSLFDAAQERGYGVLVYQSTTGHTRRAFDWPVDGATLVDSPFLTNRKELPPDLKVVTLGALTDPEHDRVRL